MLAHALFALLLPVVQAADGTCRLSTGPDRCWSRAELQGSTLAVPRLVSRMEPSSIRLCPLEVEPPVVNLGVVLPVIKAAGSTDDSAFEGILGAFQDFATAYPTSNVSLALPSSGRLDVANLLPAPGDPAYRARFAQASNQSAGLANLVVNATATTRLYLHGSLSATYAPRPNPILVVFVIGNSFDWFTNLDNALASTTAQLPDGSSFRVGSVQGQLHLVHLSVTPNPVQLSDLQSLALRYGAESHQLANPTSWSVDSLLRSFYGRVRQPAPLLRGLEIANLGSNVVSRAYGGLDTRDTARIVLDSALPLAEGINRIRMVRRISDGPYNRRDTTDFRIDVSAPGTGDGATPDGMAAWTCPGPSTLDMPQPPTREMPKADLLLRTLAPGLTHLRVQVVDSATGKTAWVYLEGRRDTTWIGNLFAPPDSQGAPFSFSPAGDRLVTRWEHPRDPRDTLRDTVRIAPAGSGWIQVSSPAVAWPGGDLGIRVWTPSTAGDTLRVQVRCGEGFPTRTIALPRRDGVWTGSARIGSGKRPYPEVSTVLCPEPRAGQPLPSISIVVSEGLRRDVPMVDRPVASGSPTCAVRMRPGACVDPAKVPPAGWSLPSNTTHADFRRLVLCLPDSSIPAPARIVWVVDNSGSMSQNDPGNLRFEAVQWGLSRQALLNPQSRAAIVRFSSAATTDLPMTTLDSAGLATALVAARVRSTEGTTNWEAALDLAMAQFQPEDDGQPAAIVLVTDGMPNLGAWERAVRPGMPPVYSIYIGDLGQPTAELRDLGLKTAGRNWMLGSQPNRILVEDAVRTITGLFRMSPTLFRGSLINGAAGQASTYREFSQSGVGGPVEATTEKVLALAADTLNSLRFSYLTAEDPYVPRDLEWSFSLTDPPSQAGMEIAGSPFLLSCQVPGALRFLDSTGRAVDWLPSQETGFGIELAPARTLKSSTSALVRSVRTADSGRVDLLDPSSEEGSTATSHVGKGTLASLPAPGSVAVDTLGDSLVARWCDERVPRDCIEGRIALVRVASPPVLRLVDLDPRGPSGALRVEIAADPLAPESLAVTLRGGVRESLLVVAVRGPDGLHRATAPYRQGVAPRSLDTLFLARPAPGASSRIVATVVTGPDTARDTTDVRRALDTLWVEPGELPGTLVVRLSVPGRSPAGRVVRLSGPAGTDSVTLGPDGRAVVDAGPLVGATRDSSRIVGRTVDPVDLDTLADTARIPALPSTSVRFLGTDPSGPRGAISLEARAPGSADSLAVRISWKTDSVTVVLLRRPDGTYAGTFPFSQEGGTGSDSLHLPARRVVDLVATVPATGRRTASRDTATIATAAEDWTVERLDSGVVETSSGSASGIPARILVVTESVTTPVPTRSVDGRDLATVATWDLLGESRDSATVRIARIDPVYGDTSWKLVRVASPWHPSTLQTAPDTVDPRADESIAVQVRDRDPRADRLDSVTVGGPDGRTWTLAETAASSGIFTARIPARDLDPRWSSHSAGTSWTVPLLYVDRDHPADSSRKAVALRIAPLPAESTSVRITTDRPDDAAGTLRIEVDSPLGSDTVEVEIAWDGDGKRVLRMVRDATGRFVVEIPYARWTGAESDTLRLPAMRTIQVRAEVLPDASRRPSRSRVTLSSRPLELDLVEGDSSRWRAIVRGAEGPATVLRVRLPDTSLAVPLSRGPSRDSAEVDVTAHLRESRDSVEVEFLLVDPVYRDTVRAVRRVASPWHPAPPESTQVHVTVADPDAVSGRLAIEVVSPRGGDTLAAVVAWSGGQDTVRLVRGRDGAFRLELPYSRWTGAESDTVRLPGTRDLGIEVRVLPDSTRLASRDSLHLGSRRLDPVLRERGPFAWTATVPGAAGPVSRIVVRTSTSSATLTLRRGASGDSLDIALDRLLPESRDSIDVEFVWVDPVFGDSVRTTRRVASPWHAASLESNPDTIDVLGGGLATLTVRDRDTDPTRTGTIVVRSSAGTEFVLSETSPSSGVYTREIPSWLLDTTWIRRAPDSRWDVDLVYADPDHPGDTARASIELVRPAAALSFTVVHPIHPLATGSRTGPRLQAGPSRFLSSDMSPEQGIEIASWAPVDLDVFAYDAMGVWIAKGTFRLDPDPVRYAHRFLLTWDGRDETGEPVTAGIYLLRVVVRDRQGRLLTNQVFRLGRKAPVEGGGS